MKNTGQQKPHIKSSESGIAYTELLVAMSILVVGMVGVLQLLSTSISSNQLVTDQYIASYLAAEGIEVVKNLVDANVMQGNDWLNGVILGSPASVDLGTVLPGPGTSCGPKLNHMCGWQGEDRNLTFNQGAGVYEQVRVGAPARPPIHRFNRSIFIEQLSADEIRVTVTVRWFSRGNRELSVDVQDHFFNWRP